jgi:hypothetical protein
MKWYSIKLTLLQSAVFWIGKKFTFFGKIGRRSIQVGFVSPPQGTVSIVSASKGRLLCSPVCDAEGRLLGCESSEVEVEVIRGGLYHQAFKMKACVRRRAGQTFNAY